MHLSELASEITGETNRLYALRDELVAKGLPVVDLVSGNVTDCWKFSQQHLQEILRLSAAAADRYQPDPLGQRVARAAIANYYGSGPISADNIVLTPGTSVSFQYCFQLLADRGDEILCPRPSYPLFDVIAKLCGVELVAYNLDEHRAWAIDFASIESRISSRTRAIVLISPHNPTGMVASAEEIERLAEIAVRHKLPIISDEVFCEFLCGEQAFSRVANTNAPLVFTLNGFSKMFALPGIKVGWIAVSGEQRAVSQAMRTLEMISDTFLPVSEIAQYAIAEIFASGDEFRKQYVAGVTACRSAAMQALHGVALVAPQGGFYLTVPIQGDEDEAAEHLLRDKHVLVHPGYFYEMAGKHFVMTFVLEPASIEKCFAAIKQVACATG